MNTDTQFNDALAAHLTCQAHPRPHPPTHSSMMCLQQVSIVREKRGSVWVCRIQPVQSKQPHPQPVSIAQLILLVVLLAVVAGVTIAAKG